MKIKNEETKISITVEPPADYETYSLLRKFINFAILWPFLYLISHLSFVGKFLLAQRSSEDARLLKENAGNHIAIEKMYLHNWRNYPTATQKLYNLFWGSFGNVMAVRNRLKLVKRTVSNHTIFLPPKFLPKRKNKIFEVNILSVACGSGRSILETLKKIVSHSDNKINVVLADNSREALRYAAQLAEKTQFPNAATLTLINEDIFKIRIPKENFDIIEVVGLLEYLPNEKVSRIMQKLRAGLKSGGILITSNILPNPERRFIAKIINWPLIYRTADELAQLAVSAGFSEIEVKIEPLGIQAVAVCKK